MADQISVRFSKTRVIEGSQILLTAEVRDNAAAEIPTTLEYKLYNETRSEITKDWTSITPASEATITIPAELTGVRHKVMERFSVIVAANRGMAGAAFGESKCQIMNISGYTYDDRNLILNLLTEDYQSVKVESGEGIQV